MNIPPYFIIPTPVEIPVQRGIASTNGPNGCLIQCRGTTMERDKIQRAANLLGLTYGTFMRRVVNDFADAVIQLSEGKELPVIPQSLLAAKE